MAESISIVRWDGRSADACEDELAGEEPMEIRVRGRAISVTMRTPGHDADLIAGFLLSEGIVRRANDILKIEPCDRDGAENVLNVLLAPDVHVDFQNLTRHVFASSSCGICGKSTIESVHSTFPPIESSVRVSAKLIISLPHIMRKTQTEFDRTGGLHAAAIFDCTGKIIILREDVGRHNAVDKVLGYCLMNGTALDQCLLLVSGRTSFEILQKALAGRLPIVAAVSAPSSLAVEFARENRQTLIGFLRDDRMNVYAHPERIDFHG